MMSPDDIYDYAEETVAVYEMLSTVLDIPGVDQKPAVCAMLILCAEMIKSKFPENQVSMITFFLKNLEKKNDS